MSTALWVIFWFLFILLLLSGSLFVRLNVFYPLLFICVMIDHYQLAQYEIEHTVFWVLFVLLFLTARQNSLSLIFFVVLNLHRLWPYLPTLHDRLSLWLVAVWVFVNYALFVFMLPLGWHVFWMPIMAITAVFICRDRTARQLMIWTTAMIGLRIFVNVFYLFYVTVTPFKWAIFPFNLFSQRWQASKSRWYPCNAREPDTIRDTKLCERCNTIVGNSGLIIGSRWPLTRMLEWHSFGSKERFWTECRPKDQQPRKDQQSFTDGQPFTQSSEEAIQVEQSTAEQLPISQFTRVQPISEQCPAEQPTEQHAKKIQALGGSSCTLCNLLWYSMSAKRRMMDLLWVPKYPSQGLRLKIWEERPLTLYTYVQLFWGEIPLGTRILVHREGNFANRQFAPRESDYKRRANSVGCFSKSIRQRKMDRV
jgi:hypothetical protein